MVEDDVSDFHRKMLMWISAALLIAGISLYWGWAVMYDTWYPFTRGNIGIYTIFVPMIGFGLLGLLLYSKKPAPAK